MKETEHQKGDGEGHSRTYRQSFLRGAVYLSLAAVVVKVLSAVYKVPYQNITGDTGFYVYQQVYPFYGAALVLATYGFPVVISRLVANEYKTGGHGAVKELLTVAFTAVALVNFILGSLLLLSAPQLAVWMGDPGLAVPLRAMAAPFFLMPFVSVLRGYYQGMQWMTPSAVSQVGEQIFRVTAILILSAWAMAEYGPYEAGTAAAAGSFFGAAAALFILIAAGRGTRRQSAEGNQKQPFINVTYIKWKKHGSAILKGGFFVCLSAMSLVAMQLIDSLMLIQLLRQSGLSVEAAGTVKGIYDRGWPIVQLGTVLTTSFSLSLVPLVATAALNEDHILQQTYTVRALKTGVLFGGAAAVGLLAVMPALNPMLFTDTSGEAALQLISLSVLPASIFLTGAAILHGAGRGKSLLWLTLTGLAVKSAGNAVLVPAFSINGAAASTTAAFTVMAAGLCFVLYRMELLLLPGKRKQVTQLARWTAALGLTAVAAAAIQTGTSFVMTGDTGAMDRAVMTTAALTASAGGAVVFFISAVVIRVITKEEWRMLPKVGSIMDKLERKKGADRR
ncbi:putative polysaccharide biosynthesis protein [Alteribacter natronophilus]|uniref:putative polysaccharide biosynthesis protein n=1 Tax=Alteribacter natronophilus TaxID=2583810 RepID=UPI00110E81DF|nr:oligosaccharide flippase family protein [Alteribacter natronophilus]TMW69952.1 hypothetical protein FGB90_18885 [Alteribacter natronophilus]